MAKNESNKIADLKKRRAAPLITPTDLRIGGVERTSPAG